MLPHLNWSDLVPLISTAPLSLIALVGLGFGFWFYRKHAGANRFQTQLHRFDQLWATATTANGYPIRLLLDHFPPENDVQVQLAALRYFHLCAETFYLTRQKLLPAKLVQTWQKEFNKTLRRPLFVQSWAILKPEFDTFPEFVGYVNAVQSQFAKA